MSTQASHTKTTEDRSFIARAQDKAGIAATATIDAVKDHPVAAAAIAGGVAAAVAGAAYGVTKLRDS